MNKKQGSFMAKNNRSMSEEEINLVIEIIKRFRSKPTWPEINKRANKAGIEYSLRAIQAKNKIVTAYKEKVTDFKAKKTSKKEAREDLGLPTDNRALQAEVLRLRATLEDVEARNRELERTLESILASALKHDIPLSSLDRPIRK